MCHEIRNELHIIIVHAHFSRNGWNSLFTNLKEVTDDYV